MGLKQRRKTVATVACEICECHIEIIGDGATLFVSNPQDDIKIFVCSYPCKEKLEARIDEVDKQRMGLENHFPEGYINLGKIVPIK
jgi:hypothetical protein